tara:strand:- start:2610 stop:3092 length:483 start_codon:yes stop_codon:yes gene_type:complete
MAIKFLKKPLLILIFFYVNTASTQVIDKKKILNLNISSFDVVEKDLKFSEEIPTDFKNLTKLWFDEKVKVNGFEGKITIYIDEYSENISTIDDGKRIDISINFNAEISKLNNKKINKAKGNVSSFGTMVGDFSLNEFDVLISNTQSELIVILSKKLETFF